MKKLLSLLCFFGGYLSAQSIYFENTIGGTSQDIGRSAIQTYDNQFVAVGYTSSYGAGSSDIWLIKVLPTGFLKWSKTFGGAGVDLGYCVLETVADSGLIIAGYTNSYGAGGYDCYLIKTDSLGNTKWTKTYGGSGWDMAFHVTATSDGGYILVGGTYSYGAGDEDVYLIKTNSTGDTLWTRTYGGKKQDEGRSVKQTMDGGYIIAGTTKSFGDTVNGNAYIIRTKPNGDTLWTRNFGGKYADDAADIIEFADSTFYFVGGTSSYCYGPTPGSNEDVFTGKLSAAGDSLHLLHCGNFADDRSEAIIQLSPTRCMVMCNTKSAGFANNTFDMWPMLTDQYGDYLMGTTFGDPHNPSDEVGYSVCRTNDNGYLLCGYSNGFNAKGIPDFFLVKIDSAEDNPPIIAGIENFSSAHIQVNGPYPNPINDQTTLILSGDQKSGLVQMRLFDLSGRNLSETIHEYYFLQNGKTEIKIQFNRSELPPGMYFYELQVGDQKGSGKLILR